MPLCGIRYSRVVGSSESFALPGDPWRRQATCHHNNPRLMEPGEQLPGLFKKQYLYLMYVRGHSYEFNDRNNRDRIEDFCRLMGSKEDIWYCTNIELMDCLDDFNRLRFSANNSFVYNPNASDSWIEVSGRICRISSRELVSL